MLLIPAIDLKDGDCVRLKQGRMEDDTVFSHQPVEAAEQWIKQGAQRLHIVDLNGAFAGKPINESVIEAICRAYPETPVQIGGGIRSLDAIERYLSMGVRYCILGTKAVEDPNFVQQACRTFPDAIIVGIDAKKGRVATDGWAQVSTIKATELAKQFEGAGVSAIVYTDIDRDGMMMGVNAEETIHLAQNVQIPIIASGGIRDINDIRRLSSQNQTDVFGAILGRSIYEGSIQLEEAIMELKLK